MAVPDETRRLIESLAAPMASRMQSPPTVASSTTEAAIAAVNADGTLDVEVGGAVMTVPATTACSGAAAGDTALLTSYGARLYATGVIASGRDFLLPSSEAVGTWTDTATVSSVASKGYKDAVFDYAGVFSQMPAVIPILGTVGATNANYGSISLNVVNRTSSSCTVRVHNSGTGTVSPTIRVWAFGLKEA